MQQINCEQCGKPNKNSRFCSKACTLLWMNGKRKGMKTRIPKPKIACQHCKELFEPRIASNKFCGRKCKDAASRKYYDRVCQCCGKNFQVNNIYEIKRGDHKYCSKECGRKKYSYKEVDFLNEQDSEKIYWLGFLFAASCEIEEESVSIIDTREMIEAFQKYLASNLPVTEKGKLHKITIHNRAYSRYLRITGLREDFYKEAPLIEVFYVKDFIRGYFDSTKGYIYKNKGKNVVAIHGEDSKLMRYFADMLDAKLVYKTKEWIVVSFDFDIICMGLPRNKKKWHKFLNHKPIINL